MNKTDNLSSSQLSPNSSQRKKFYKKWWAWTLLVIIILFILFKGPVLVKGAYYYFAWEGYKLLGAKTVAELLEKPIYNKRIKIRGELTDGTMASDGKTVKLKWDNNTIGEDLLSRSMQGKTIGSPPANAKTDNLNTSLEKKDVFGLEYGSNLILPPTIFIAKGELIEGDEIYFWVVQIEKSLYHERTHEIR